MVKETEYNKEFISQRADPYCYKHTDGTYYFTGSVPAYDRIVLRAAKTIAGLADAEEKTIWVKHDGGPMSFHIWAPEIHYIDGRWFVYFAAGEKEDIWKIRPYILECEGQDPMTDAWKECGPMKPADEDEFSFRAFSLDATTFEHKGERYSIWAEKVGVGRQISNLYIAKMENPYKLKTVQVLLTTPDYDWERIGFWVNEGPAVLKHDNKIFVAFSASATDANYCTGMLEADADSDLLDPQSWKKYRYPILKTDSEKEMYGPGHNSFVKSEDGTKDIMVFHARPYEKLIAEPLRDPNRHAYYLEVEWDADGRPVFNYRNQNI